MPKKKEICIRGLSGRMCEAEIYIRFREVPHLTLKGLYVA